MFIADLSKWSFTIFSVQLFTFDIQSTGHLKTNLEYFQFSVCLGTTDDFCNQFSPFFPVYHCPLGFAELQACPFPDVVFPPLPLSALSSYLFHCALQDGIGQTWWTEDMTIPLQFASLYDRQEIFVWSSCLLDLAGMQTRGPVSYTHLIQRPRYQREIKIQQAIRPHEDLLTIVKTRKLKWYGHVSRSSGLAKTILQGTVKGGRRQGRQQQEEGGNKI